MHLPHIQSVIDQVVYPHFVDRKQSSEETEDTAASKKKKRRILFTKVFNWHFVTPMSKRFPIVQNQNEYSQNRKFWPNKSDANMSLIMIYLTVNESFTNFWWEMAKRGTVNAPADISKLSIGTVLIAANFIFMGENIKFIVHLAISQWQMNFKLITWKILRSRKDVLPVQYWSCYVSDSEQLLGYYRKLKAQSDFHVSLCNISRWNI